MTAFHYRQKATRTAVFWTEIVLKYLDELSNTQILKRMVYFYDVLPTFLSANQITSDSLNFSA